MSVGEYIEGFKLVVDIVGVCQDWTEQEYEKLVKSAETAYAQQDYEKALSISTKLAHKSSKEKGKARFLYFSARCLVNLKRYENALQSCESAIQSSPDDELLQAIYALKARIQFGAKFWIQWLAATIIAGLLGLIGTAWLSGSQLDNASTGVVGVLSAGVLIGFAQWLLVRLRTHVGIAYLITSIAVVLVSSLIALMTFSVSPWLGLVAFMGGSIIFMTLSIGRLSKQVKVTA
jgi:Tetratricopeptide repeat